MTEQNKVRPSGVWRGVVITLMALTVAFTLLAAVGTLCAALGAENYDSMVALVPYKPLYQALVVISLAVGVWGIRVVFSLVRSGPTAYRNALLVLVIGALSAGVQMGVSQALRGKSAPVNMRVYLTVFTLIVFLLLRWPPLWARVDFTQSLKGKNSKTASGGTALMVCGVVVATTRWWVGASHISNWVEIPGNPLQVGGWGMVIIGIVMLLVAASTIPRKVVKYLGARA